MADDLYVFQKNKNLLLHCYPFYYENAKDNKCNCSKYECINCLLKFLGLQPQINVSNGVVDKAKKKPYSKTSGITRFDILVTLGNSGILFSLALVIIIQNL